MEKTPLRFPGIAALAALFLAAAGTASAEAPKVVASIVPVHGLVAAVMEGMGEPRLIAAKGSSPHAYALKPSDARALADADVVFWIAPQFESFMARAVETLGGNARVVDLAKAQGITLLPVRAGGLFAGAGAGAGADAATDHAARDFHIFLDPENGIAMAREIIAVLSRADPENAARYQANGENLIAATRAKETEIRLMLAGAARSGFIVYHDATQYFENRFGLSAVGSISGQDEAPPGAAHVAAIRDYLKANPGACVLREPQTANELVEGLVADTGAAIGVVDPDAADFRFKDPEAIRKIGFEHIPYQQIGPRQKTEK